MDTASPVTRPVAAGPYAIGATITDDNYVWQTEDGKYNTVYTLEDFYIDCNLAERKNGDSRQMDILRKR